MNDTFPEEMPAVPRNGRCRIGPTLASAVKQSATLPDRIILYGPPGVGKTSLAAYLPDPIFLMTPGEDRLKKLIANGLVPPTGHFPDLAENWNDVEHVASELTVSEHDYKTFVLDTTNGAERLAQEEHAREKYNGEMSGKWSEFSRGERDTANALWPPFLALLDRLRERKRMRIVLLCHSGIVSTKNPEGADYDKIQPTLSKVAWSYTARWADMILYMTPEVKAEKDDPKSKFQKAKGKGGRVRLLHTSATASYEAKNCHGLPATIRLGDDPGRAFAAFRAAFPTKPKAEAKAAEPQATKESNGQPQQDSADRPVNP